MTPLLATTQNYEVIVEHTSSFGPTATHIRGTLLVNSLANLRGSGHYERYLELLPPRVREPITFALAQSWVPIELALMHYEACDELGLSDQEIGRMSELTAQRIADTFMATALRAWRNAGADLLWQALRRNDWLFDRLYQGGGITILKTGPKDLILENHGLPLARCRFWRIGYLSYMRAVGSMFAKVVYTRPIRPRQPHPHSIAIAGSWV